MSHKSKFPLQHVYRWAVSFTVQASSFSFTCHCPFNARHLSHHWRCVCKNWWKNLCWLAWKDLRKIYIMRQLFVFPPTFACVYRTICHKISSSVAISKQFLNLLCSNPNLQEQLKKKPEKPSQGCGSELIQSEFRYGSGSRLKLKLRIQFFSLKIKNTNRIYKKNI
jgi:hypothetical protein